MVRSRFEAKNSKVVDEMSMLTQTYRDLKLTPVKLEHFETHASRAERAAMEREARKNESDRSDAGSSES